MASSLIYWTPHEEHLEALSESSDYVSGIAVRRLLVSSFSSTVIVTSCSSMPDFLV
jgi:hypothetical protein